MVYVDLYIYKTWMEGTYDLPLKKKKKKKKKKSLFLRDYWTKSDRVFAEIQTIR